MYLYPPPTPISLGLNSFYVYFALLFGWGGKTAINVFILITGYFMCRQEFKWKKILFLTIEIIFYRWIIYLIFLISGYETFNLKEFVKVILTIPFNFGKGFTATFLGLYLIVPYLNKLTSILEKKDFEKLIIILLSLFTVFSTFFLNSSFEYLGWYTTVYLIGSYIRLYEANWMRSIRTTAIFCISNLVLSWMSVVVIRFVAEKINRPLPYYYFVSDSNKILALTTGISLFLFFKNIKIGNNKIINTLAASTFGVLLIHASSDTMRRWLWQDVCNNVEALYSNYFVWHAIFCTIAVYLVCIIIDIIRKFLVTKIFNKFCMWEISKSEH